jgi:U3 small nucleolar RNA-associated protein 7
MFNLDLPDFAPYTLKYTPNGVHALVAGRLGHVASFDWKRAALGCEMQVRRIFLLFDWLAIF